MLNFLQRYRFRTQPVLLLAHFENGFGVFFGKKLPAVFDQKIGVFDGSEVQSGEGWIGVHYQHGLGCSDYLIHHGLAEMLVE